MPKADIPKPALRELAIAAAFLVRAWRAIEGLDAPRYSAASEALRASVPPDLLEDLADALDRFAFPARVLWGEWHEQQRQARLTKGA